MESGGGGGSNSNSNSKARRDRAQDSYPDCLCGAGKCEIVQERTGKYFVCPIQKGHGACSFRTAVFCTQPPKTAMSDFKEDSQGGCLSPKRMKFDSPVVENPDQMSTPVGPSPRIEEVAIESDNYGDILDMSTIQEMVMEDGETDVLLMEKSLQISRLPTKANQRRQIEFLRQISASEDATSAGIFLHGCGALIPGWLGRLAFPPSGCVTIPQAKPFFCCVFPSLDPISIPKGVDTFNSGALNDQPHTPFNAEPDSSLQISSLDSQSGILLGLSSILNVPGIRQGRDFTRQISRALVEVGVHVQSQLLTILDYTESRNHRSMMEAADKTFSLLNQLSVDHRSFSEHVRKFISCTSSLAKIEESMMAGQSSEEIMEWYDYERANFDKLSRMQAETEDAVTASDKRLKSLGEEASRLKRMLLQVEDQWRHCEKENAELKTRSRKISKDILELEKKLQEAETAKRLHEEREMERNAAKISLEMARIQLRQSVFKV